MTLSVILREFLDESNEVSSMLDLLAKKIGYHDNETFQKTKKDYMIYMISLALCYCISPACMKVDDPDEKVKELWGIHQEERVNYILMEKLILEKLKALMPSITISKLRIDHSVTQEEQLKRLTGLNDEHVVENNATDATGNHEEQHQKASKKRKSMASTESSCSKNKCDSPTGSTSATDNTETSRKKKNKKKKKQKKQQGRKRKFEAESPVAVVAVSPSPAKVNQVRKVTPTATLEPQAQNKSSKKKNKNSFMAVLQASTAGELDRITGVSATDNTETSSENVVEDTATDATENREEQHQKASKKRRRQESEKENNNNDDASEVDEDVATATNGDNAAVMESELIHETYEFNPLDAADAKEIAWDQKYFIMIEYAHKHKNLIPNKKKMSKVLYNFVTGQKSSIKKNKKFNVERKKALFDVTEFEEYYNKK